VEDEFLSQLKAERDKLAEAAHLLFIPDDSPFREREREIWTLIREHRERMRD